MKIRKNKITAKKTSYLYELTAPHFHLEKLMQIFNSVKEKKKTKTDGILNLKLKSVTCRYSYSLFGKPKKTKYPSLMHG